MGMREVGGGYVWYQKSKGEKIRGKDLKGIRAKNLLKQLAEKTSASPLVVKDVRLIEGISIIGADDLTARDQAIYEYMLLIARKNGMDRDFHQVDVNQIWDYLHTGEGSPDRRLDRLQDSLVRLTRTIVRYTHRDQYNRTYGATSLVTGEIHEDLSNGTAILDYTIPQAVRHAVLSATRYTWLEINAFAGFKSRYASRLYQRLAIGAGMDGPAGKRWEVTPVDLATILGYPIDPKKRLHYASFRRRCLEPAMSDIEREVGRFNVSMREVPGKGRGRPIKSICFEIGYIEKLFEELKAAHVPVHLADHQRTEERHPTEHLPSRLALGRAVTLTGHRPDDLFEGWLKALDRAKADPSLECAPTLEGSTLLYFLGDDTDGAFGMWATNAQRVGTIEVALPSKKPQPEVMFPASPDEVLPELRYLLKAEVRSELNSFMVKLYDLSLDTTDDATQAMERVLLPLIQEDAMPLLVKADKVLAGKIISVCRHAANQRLHRSKWLHMFLLLIGGQPQKALEAFDQFLPKPPNTLSTGLFRRVPPPRTVELNALDDLDDLTGFVDMSVPRSTGEFSDEIPF